MGRGRPSTWAKYSIASIGIKSILKQALKELIVESLSKSYKERIQSGRLKFYNNQIRKIGRKMLRNRLADVINGLDMDWLQANDASL